MTQLLLAALLFVSAGQVGDDSPVADKDTGNSRPRLRDLGIRIGVLPTGPHNAVTDVKGVTVGHRTLIDGDSVRTGVTAIRPHQGNLFLQKVPAAVHVANGFGKFTGTTQIEELGVLETPVVLTNTLSTFTAADALIGWTLSQPGCESVLSVNPVVGECNDGFLNDIRARQVQAADVEAAVNQATGGRVREGCVGAGTGVRCMGWKGGIGTSSRVLPESLGGYTVGVLVQTNFGGSLTIDGVPVGRETGRYYLKDAVPSQEHGSCIVIVATDAPLDSRGLGRLARRAPLGLAAAGSPISHGSGDYVLAFSVAEELRAAYTAEDSTKSASVLRDDRLSPLFQAVRDATEEAVINSVLKAVTMQGRNGRLTEAIDPAVVVGVLQRYGRQAALPGTDDHAGTQTVPMSDPQNYGHPVPESLQHSIATMEALLPQEMQQHAVPGVAVAVIHDRRLVWARGYGVRCAGTHELVQPWTVMEACSMSKPFYAYMLLKLAENGRFDPDRPLVEYLGGDYIDDEPLHRKITARMVLSHTSGLPNWRRGGWRAGGPMAPAFEPGTAFRYSGEGFLMLQRAAEALTETGLDEFSEAALIRPLGLTHTRFVRDDRLVAESACGHDSEGSPKPDRRFYESANAAYSLYTSAEDYARFLVEMMQHDRAAPHSLGRKALDEMLQAVSRREDQSADWGLGWGLRTLNSEKLVYHSGSNGTGFRCYSEFLPDRGLGIVIMTNAVGGKELWNSVISRLHEDPSWTAD